MPVVKQPNIGPPSTAIDNNDSPGDIDLPSLNKSGKLQPFEEDIATKQQFEKQLSKFADTVMELTPYTIYGLSLKSEFSIAV